MRDHARESILARIRIDAGAAMRDAPDALDAGRFHDHQRRTGICQHAEMRRVPRARDAVIGAVLAHRRDDDAVGKIEAGELDRREKCTGHGQDSLAVRKTLWGQAAGGRIMETHVGEARRAVKVRLAREALILRSDPTALRRRA
jgi:hypothetical protein